MKKYVEPEVSLIEVDDVLTISGCQYDEGNLAGCQGANNTFTG